MFPLKFCMPVCLFCMLSMSTVYALEQDAKEKLYINSKSSLFNYKTGVKIYEGDVSIDQGTSHLTADKVITKENEKHKIKEAIAYGKKKRAHYWTLLKQGDPVMHAYANVITLYPLNADVILNENVYVKQGENHFTGSLVLYNNNTQIITIPASSKGRAQLVYNPNQAEA